VKVVVTGGAGRVGRALGRRGGAHEIVALARPALDIRDAGDVGRALDEHAPAVVINAAAYTAVDRAQSDREEAFAVNESGAGHVARACETRQIPMIHLSTDHVFDGTATRPYREDDAVAPRSVYGQSKAAGEEAVRAAGGTVVRTSWLFGEGDRGFVPSIAARLRAGDQVRAVADQHGCPTWVDDLADALLALAAVGDIPDVLHYCGEGPTTWHGLAVAIASAIGVDPSRITAIRSDEWAAPAPRPAYAVLDTERVRGLGIAPVPWHRGLLTILLAEGRTRGVGPLA